MIWYDFKLSTKLQIIHNPKKAVYDLYIIYTLTIRHADMFERKSSACWFFLPDFHEELTELAQARTFEGTRAEQTPRLLQGLYFA